MTTVPRRRQTSHLFRWFSTGYDRARSNSTATPVLARQSSLIDPDMPLDCRPLSRANVLNPHNRARGIHSPAGPAVLKSP
jgi:hypothetical protein